MDKDQIVADWHKSSRSKRTDCVEVGRTVDGAAVRDTKNRAAGYIEVSADRWMDFIKAVKSDQFLA